jgi:hypothetical protein
MKKALCISQGHINRLSYCDGAVLELQWNAVASACSMHSGMLSKCCHRDRQCLNAEIEALVHSTSEYAARQLQLGPWLQAAQADKPRSAHPPQEEQQQMPQPPPQQQQQQQQQQMPQMPQVQGQPDQ